MTEKQLMKLQCEHLRQRIEEKTSVFRDNFEGVVSDLVKEGKIVGAAPWCADIYCEMEAYKRLNHIGNYAQESMEVTLARRKKQPHLMIKIMG